MMKPWISTSLPAYDFISCVTSKFARIESTSWAKVNRGVSSLRAASAPPSNARPASSATSPRTRTRRSGQRREVLIDVHPVGAQRGDESGQHTQEHHAGDDDRL